MNNKERSINIGINYAGTRAQLNGCVSDSVNMAALMLKLGIEDVVLMIDHDFNRLAGKTSIESREIVLDNRNKITLKPPTKKNVLNQIKEAVEDSSINSLFISYAGHGTQGRYSKSNTEEADGKDEYICTLNNSGNFDGKLSSFVSDDAIFDTIEKASKMREDNSPLVITYVFDCCHSGTVFDLPYTMLKINDNVTFNTESCKNFSSTQLTVSGWSGCQDNQLSQESKNWQSGVTEGRCTKSFIYAVEQLVLNAKNSSDKVTNYELHDLILKVLFYIDGQDDRKINTSSKYQVINHTSSKNIGLDTSGTKLITQIFAPGSRLDDYSYSNVERVLSTSQFATTNFMDTDKVDLNLY
jgi:Caspase domain